jgi:hypothetical protein
MKREVINSRERAVSTDINRLQDFLASEVGQLFFEQVGKSSVSDDHQPGTESSPAVGSTPPFNAVLNGLRPYPINGTRDLLITPGVLLSDNLASTGDDSPLLYCNDPGINAAGVLQLTTSPGAVRIDVLECQPTTAVLETDNRDIYNIVTGLFAPAMVTKVTAARLTYRIRTGTPGAGFPGLVAGWIPIMVCRVDAAATTWDTCDLWDVRNLVSEFWNSPFQSELTDAEVTDAHLAATETAAGAPYGIQLTGKVAGRFRHFRIGGSAKDYPVGSAYVDITTGTSNWAAGMVVLGLLPWYVYLAFPFGLPGWRKYAGSTVSPRTPAGLRGIPIVVSATPAPMPSRAPVAALALPTSLGFGGTTSDAVCVFASISDSTPRIRGGAAANGLTMHHTPIIVPATVSDPLVSGTSKYQLIDSIAVPACAKSVLLNLDLALSKAGPPGLVLGVETSTLVKVYDPTNTFVIYERVLGKQAAVIQAASTLAAWQFEVELPIPYRAGVSALFFTVSWNIQPSGAAFTIINVDQCEVQGWRM